MSYSPTVWQKGDTISATRLNKIEQGISDVYSKSTDALVLNISYNASTDEWGRLDQTLRTIYAAVLSRKKVVICFHEPYNGNLIIMQVAPVLAISDVNNLENTNYEKWITTQGYNFMAYDPDEYPSICWW